eukprot:11171333-Prorocentrum_lima.AAC.1
MFKTLFLELLNIATSCSKSFQTQDRRSCWYSRFNGQNIHIQCYALAATEVQVQLQRGDYHGLLNELPGRPA